MNYGLGGGVGLVVDNLANTTCIGSNGTKPPSMLATSSAISKMFSFPIVFPLLSLFGTESCELKQAI